MALSLDLTEATLKYVNKDIKQSHTDVGDTYRSGNAAGERVSLSTKTKQ